MYVDIMTGKKLSSIQVTNIPIGQFVHLQEGWDWCKGPATSFALLENMKIWCKIQEIINPLNQHEW